MADARATTVGTDTLAAPRVGTAERVAERPHRPVPWGTLVVHALLLACVAVIAFPLYYAFVISTQTVEEVIARPPILRPSGHALQNYADAWGRAQMGRLLVNSAIVAVVSAAGKILISMLSAFASTSTSAASGSRSGPSSSR